MALSLVINFIKEFMGVKIIKLIILINFIIKASIFINLAITIVIKFIMAIVTTKFINLAITIVIKFIMAIVTTKFIRIN